MLVTLGWMLLAGFPLFRPPGIMTFARPPTFRRPGGSRCGPTVTIPTPAARVPTSS